MKIILKFFSLKWKMGHKIYNLIQLFIFMYSNVMNHLEIEDLITGIIIMNEMDF